MADKILIKVLDGRDFRERWDGLFIKSEDFENISCGNYEEELHNLFEYHSFPFNENLHEVWEVE